MKELFTKEEKELIVFGTGTAAAKMVSKAGLSICFYVDNDTKKWGSTFQGKEVKPPEVLQSRAKQGIIILVASMYYEDIKIQLEGMGFEESINFYNLSDFFINPLDINNFTIDLSRTWEIFKLIRLYMDNGCYSDAGKLLEEYESYNFFDERIALYKALIALQKGELVAAQALIKKGIEAANSNYEAYHACNVAGNMVRNEDYLRALELYERIILETASNQVKVQVYEALTGLEASKSEQLSYLLGNRVKQQVDGEHRVNLHLMFDSFHNRSFIEFFLKYYQGDTNVFLIYYFGEHPSHMDEGIYTNVYTIRITEADALYIMQKSVSEYMCNCKAVFIHYLHDLFCELIMKSYIKDKLIYWILWGGDVYSYARNIKLYDDSTSGLLQELGLGALISLSEDYVKQRANIYRRAAIRKIDYIMTWIKGDYEVLKSNFITNAKRLEYIFPNPVNFQMINDSGAECSDYDWKEKYRNVIMLGNSADPANNHVEILEHLSKFRDKDFCVILALSYGNATYSKRIIEIGEELLGNKFIPITEYIEPRKYSMLLKQVDVAIMNHNRQQGVGNILALLYLGKKVYIKGRVSPLSLLRELGVEIYDEKVLFDNTFDELFRFDKAKGASNSRIIYENFNEKRIKQCTDAIF